MPTIPRQTSPLRRIATLTPTVALMTLLAGCMVGPDYERPNLYVPATWSTADGKTASRPAELAYWWSTMKDPQLDSLIARAIEGNRSVAVAQARVREARATLGEETGKLAPTLGGTSSVNRTKTAEVATTIGADDVFTQYRSGFDAGWEIDLFGGKRRGVEAAKYGLDAAEEELRNTMLVLVGDVASNYAQVRAAQARLALGARTARSQRQSAALTRAKLEGGSGTTADVARAEALAASTEADLPTYEIARTSAVNRLGVLLGLPPATLSAELSKSKPIPRPRITPAVGIPADVLLSRPDVRLAERQLAQSTARIGASEAARYPSVSLTGNIASSALHLSDIARSSTIGWAFGPALNVPLFRGGQLKSAVNVAEARRDQSFATYEASVLTAMEEVENAIVSLSQQRRRSAKLASAVDAYRRADAASRSQYESGSLNYLDLLDGQRQLYTAEGALIESQLAVTNAYIALNKALGGGWSGQRAPSGSLTKTTPVKVKTGTGS
ncbi:efflux transporter outer membrane subunit [Agrobacterium rhizogenes]|uniref:efflux transporter outer membrane subunit n=1 Tax=Rhizobium rhizogenes TaxID=359 RepID=UPI0022B623DD|nr:efflux transporter outer membrane subunit [Rhizobium rhizogenes]MCZ7450841.1 efflux transporter outer membrane subunit [Rhizobium rhizogenes]